MPTNINVKINPFLNLCFVQMHRAFGIWCTLQIGDSQRLDVCRILGVARLREVFHVFA